MIYLVIFQILMVFLSVVPGSFAYDDSCITGGTYDGTRCGVDLNGSGDAEDCSELLICRRPDGGTCTGSVTSGYNCSSNGQHYTSLQTCQNSCGGTKPFACPPDISDPVCNGTSTLTQTTYRDMYPDDFDQNVTYTYAATKTAVPRSSYMGLSTAYGGHSASAVNSADRTYYWQTYGSGPFFVKEGTLYSDVLFYSPDQNACYRADSFDGSQWRPRDYCPGQNCTTYTTPSASYSQQWEKWIWDCTATNFTQTISAGMTYRLIVDTYVWDMPNNPSVTLYYKRKVLAVGYDSGAFYWKNDYEHYFGSQWFGEEITCVQSSTIFGHNVCTRYRHRIYGPIGTNPYTYDYNTSPYGCCDIPGGDCPLSGYCDDVPGHSWTGPPNTNTSFYTWDQYWSGYCVTNTLPGGNITHSVGLNSAYYTATHTVDGAPLTTTCNSMTTIKDCDAGTFTRCDSYTQTWKGNNWTFGLDCWNHNIMNVAGMQHDYFHGGTTTYKKPSEYRDIPLNLTGIHQWDTTKCRPCQTAANGVVTDPEDPVVDPDIVVDPNATCTNFYMFSGAGKKCRKTSINTLFSNCCDLSGWFASWCNDKERELKKRRQADTCHYVGTYCSKKIKFLGICLERKASYCCFNSKLSRIINDQGRPQIGKTWGRSKSPKCKGFTPAEFGTLDFSAIDLSEYIADIQGRVNTGVSTQEITKGIQNWMTNQNNPSPLETK